MASLGAFRDQGESLCHGLLPEGLRNLLEDSDVASFVPEFSVSQDKHRLNHAAFGAPFKPVSMLRDELTRFLEKDPSVFYDKVCLPLLRNSYSKAREVFGTDRVVLTPNCSAAMKGVMEEVLASRGKDTTVAYLPPVYGATQSLLKWLGETHQLATVSVVPVPDAYFCEDERVVEALERHHATSPFSVLVADHIASQSARILPLEAVVRWCKAHSVVLVVDGTQTFDLTSIRTWPDYFVMSTHKWLGNVKTCGVVRFGDSVPPPRPIAMSFGYGKGADQEHLWVGMTDYLPMICLAKVLAIHQAHGKKIAQHASTVLSDGLKHAGRGVLPNNQVRVMNLIQVNRFEEDLQGAMEDAGIEVSVKRIEGKRYLRVSAWSYNTAADFAALRLFLDHTVLLSRSTLDLAPEEAARRKRIEIRNDFTQTYDMYTQLFAEHMSPEAFFIKAEPLRHPLIFYYGHTAAFFMNKSVLGGWLDTTQRISPEIESACAVGVDEMSWDDCDPGNYPWGDLKTVQEKADYVARITDYRAKLRVLVLSMIMDPKHILTLPIDPNMSFFWIVMMGIEHERIHMETSSVIMARIPVQYLRPSKVFPPCHFHCAERSTAPVNSLVTVQGGPVEMGREWQATATYGWDNEFGRERCELRAFQASRMLVSNAEFMEFVEADGYKKREYWTEDGWKWAEWCPKGLPLFWVDRTTMRTLAQEMPMPWDWPVDTNNHEAAAFCKWKSEQLGKQVQLLSHEEWVLMRSRVSGGDHNLNLKEFSSACPVDCHPCQGVSEDGEAIYDVTGNLWQHSRSVLTLMPHFQAHRVYDDFTSPTIDGRHSYILGGSWSSIGDCARPEARFGFRKHFHQFAGIRYVVSDNDYHSSVPIVFENDIGPVVSEHFENYNPAKISQTVAEKPVDNWPAWFGQYAASQIKRLRAEGKSILVVNGGAGRISMEILKQCPGAKIHHSDPSAAMVRVFENLQESGRIQWQQRAAGEIDELHEYIDEDGVAKGAAGRVEYSQILLNNISGATKHHGQYDVVIAEMSQVARLQSQLPRGHVPNDISLLLRPGGSLILSTLAENKVDISTLGPFKSAGEPQHVPHMARQTARSHRFAVSEVSTWCMEGQAPRVTAEHVSGAVEGQAASSAVDYYSLESVNSQYQRLHFGDKAVFPAKVAEICVDACRRQGSRFESALDVGCGPGRTAMELGKSFSHVAAVDACPEFVASLNQRAQGAVTGYQGDAHLVGGIEALKGQKFDLILAANLIEFMEGPKQFLKQVNSLLKPNGVLVVLSSCGWQERWTPKQNWLGEFRKDAEVYPTWQGLADELKPHLVMTSEPQDVPYAMRETDGTQLCTISQCTVFGRPSEVPRPRM